jgi:hypothetical protein
MSGEAKTEAFAKRFHLGNGNHPGSGSAQHHNMRIVDLLCPIRLCGQRPESDG